MSDYEYKHVKTANINILTRISEVVGSNLLKDFNDISQLQGSPNLKKFINNGYTHNKAIIIDAFEQARPKYGYIFDDGSAEIGEDTSHNFLVKMIDGVENFTSAYPFFTFMIGIEENKRVTDAIIYDVVQGDLYYAQDNKGAFLSNQLLDSKHYRLRVGKTREIARALLGSNISDSKRVISEFIPLSVLSLGVRKSGCISLDMAYVCGNKLDGMWCDEADYITTSICKLFAKETAGALTDYDRDTNVTGKNGVLLSNLVLHRNILDFLNKPQPAVKS